MFLSSVKISFSLKNKSFILRSLPNDWIRTADLLKRKQPFYQLSHNQCPTQTNFSEMLKYLNLIILNVGYLLNYICSFQMIQ